AHASFPALTSVAWARRAKRAPLPTLPPLDYKQALPIELNTYADLRSRPLAPAIFRTRRLSAGREHSDRRQRRLALDSGSSLGLRQDRDRVERGSGRRTARCAAAALSRVLQADHQPQGHGDREPRSLLAGGVRGEPHARAHVDDAAGWPP